VQVLNETSTIELHSYQLTIINATVGFSTGKSSFLREISAQNITYDTQRQTALLDFGQSIPTTNTAFLKIHFRANLAKNMDGFYLAEDLYTDSNGMKMKRYLQSIKIEIHAGSLSVGVGISL